MSKVVAFEGNRPDALPVSWGAAAVVVNGHLYSSVTRATEPLNSLDALVQEGFLTRIAPPIDIPIGSSRSPLQVVAVKLSARFAELLEIDTGKAGGLIAHKRSGEFQYYVFDDQRARQRYASGRINDIVRRILYADPKLLHEDREALLDIGLGLNPRSPVIHALRCHFVQEAFRVRVAEATLHEDERMEFRNLLEALSTVAEPYELTYEGGVAQGGGLDIDVASRTLSNLRIVHEQITPDLLNKHPFLDEHQPAPRFQQLRAASATMIFVSDLSDRTLGERLARVLELRTLEALMRGQRPRGIRRSSRLTTALVTLAQPSPDTHVRHRRGNNAFEQVHATTSQLAADGSVEDLVLFGSQTGLMTNATVMEITVSPRFRIKCSAVDDGTGNTPKGVGSMANIEDVLFRPAKFVLQRQSGTGGTVQFWLKEMNWLEVGASLVVHALPSSFVPGAFLMDTEVMVERPTRNTLRVFDQANSDVRHRSLESTRLWVRWWSEQCKRIEIAAAASRDARWIPPAGEPKVTAIMRFLVALDSLGGQAPVARIVGTINELFQTAVRTNNTRREVLSHRDLLEFVDETEQVVAMTSLGRIFARALRKMGFMGPT